MGYVHLSIDEREKQLCKHFSSIFFNEAMDSHFHPHFYHMDHQN